MKSFKFLLFASAAMLPAVPALAQTGDTGSQSDNEEIVVVAAGIAQPARDSGRAVSVIGRAELDRTQAVTLSDALSTVPGISVTRNGGLGGFTGVRVRGAEGEQTLVLIDGVRVNDPSSPGGGYDFGNLLAGAVNSVEVLRGPNSTVWGSQAIGGVVNVVTMSGRDGFHARASAEGGSFGTWSGNAAISGGNEHLSGALTAGYTTTDGISAAANGTEADGYRQYGVTGRVEAFITPDVSVDLRGYYADSRADLDGFPPPTYSFADTGEYSTAKELYGYAGLHAALFGGALENELSFTAADIDRDNFDPAVGTTPVFFGRGSSERYLYRGNLRVAEEFRLVVGAEHEDSRFTDGSTTASTGITSFFGEAIVKPVDALTINLGMRQDDHRRFGSHASFALSGSFRPSPNTVFRANYGEGFKAPTLYQLYSFFGTPTLKPETAVSYEAGFDQNVGWLTLSGTWFHRDTTNQIDFDLGAFSYGNIARAKTEGYEVEAVAQPVAGLTLRANFTHVRAENRSPGANLYKDLARRPRDVANFAVDYRFPFDLSVGASVQLRGDSFDNASNSVKLKGFTLVNLRAEIPVSGQFSLYGRVDNVFDEQYQTVAGYGTMGRAAYAGVRMKFD
ncbi:TonB-dependent receptor [Sphingomonas sp. LB-2]|uniref:TonB-dependent receptor plug domain-containing protein n=1 Tax=Sphingomonas caeni TaxID=2984949 RepID=UPI00222F10C8|nr:TonB-dependent receptor [Sphingomonas caeni]MCW3845866.1 TonB-dependent receptor [Sphingomonas caeni]